MLPPMLGGSRVACSKVRSTRSSTWRIWTNPVNVEPTHSIPATPRDVGLPSRDLAITSSHSSLRSTLPNQVSPPVHADFFPSKQPVTIHLVISFSFTFLVEKQNERVLGYFLLLQFLKCLVWMHHVAVGPTCASAVPKHGLGQNVISQGLLWVMPLTVPTPQISP